MCCVDFLDMPGAELHSHLEEIFSVLTEKHSGEFHKLAESGGSFSFFIDLFCDRMCGEELDWETMKLLSDLRITLELAIYPESPDTPAARAG